MKNEDKTENNAMVTTFFGCNTARGFHTFYDFLPDLENARIFIVKGGPGTGKSTFIRGIAAAMREKGFPVEQQLCSLDPESLDAVVMPQIRGVVVAATGHHVFDPANPGAVDEIVNLGQFWNEKGIRRYAREIVEINRTTARLFAKAYRYLEAARQVQESIEDDIDAFVKPAGIHKITDNLIRDLFGHLGIADTPGRQRRLFASSITSRGYVSHARTLVNGFARIIELRGAGCRIRSEILKRVGEEGIRRGCRVHFCHTPLDPMDLEHVVLPESGTVVTANGEALGNGGRVETYDLEGAVAPDFRQAIAGLEDEEQYLHRLMDAAVEILSTAKKVHEQLERYYVENMDFCQVDGCRDDVVARLLRHAETFERA